MHVFFQRLNDQTYSMMIIKASVHIDLENPPLDLAARPDLEIEFGKETPINLLRPRNPPLDLGERTPKSGSKGGGF